MGQEVAPQSETTILVPQREELSLLPGDGQFGLPSGPGPVDHGPLSEEVLKYNGILVPLFCLR